MSPLSILMTGAVEIPAAMAAAPSTEAEKVVGGNGAESGTNGNAGTNEPASPAPLPSYHTLQWRAPETAGEAGKSSPARKKRLCPK